MSDDRKPTPEEMKARCEALLEDVRAGRVDPSSGEAQQLLFAGLLRGWIRQKDADAAADAYWDAQVIRCIEAVEAGERDPRAPEAQMLLDWGVQTGRISKARRKKAEAVYDADG